MPLVAPSFAKSLVIAEDPPAGSSPEAGRRFASAFVTYLKDGTVGPVPANILAWESAPVIGAQKLLAKQLGITFAAGGGPGAVSAAMQAAILSFLATGGPLMWSVPPGPIASVVSTVPLITFMGILKNADTQYAGKLSVATAIQTWLGTLACVLSVGSPPPVFPIV